MQSMVIIKGRHNFPPEKEVNEAITALGDGWRITSAETVSNIFFVGERNGPLPAIDCLYVTTVVMQKD